MADEGSIEEPVELAARIQRGDSGAEARFVVAYLPGIRVLVRKHCRPNDPVLDDIVQEVLMRVLVHLRAGELRDAVALPAYIRSMVANIAIGEYRRRERIHGGDGNESVDALSSDDGPEDSVERYHRSRLVARLLADLPMQRDREILTRHYVQDQDQDQICTDLGIDEGLYRRVLHRARERLRLIAERMGLRQH